MKGSIIKRNNKYSIVIDIGRDTFGKRKQRWFSGFNSKQEAENELPRILVKLQDGELLDNNSITLEKYAIEWLENKIKKDKLSPTTIDGYENIVYNHIIPVLGKMKLQDIKPYNLQKYFDFKFNGDKDRKGLSARTLANHNRVLKSLFISALDMELIDKNPITKVKLPREKKEECTILTLEESKKLIELVQKNLTLKMPVILSLLLGLRRGECLGLRWSDIDYENKTITISQTLQVVKGEFIFKEPKTTKSKRVIAMPESLVPILKEHYKWQGKMRLESGGTWNNERGLVCTKKTDGKPIIPHNVSERFSGFMLKNNLPVIRFHDLRHTNASLMLAAGVSAKVAGNRLGHSSISITLDLYSHVLKTVDDEAAEKLNNILNI